jgi:hypothetical protein
MNFFWLIFFISLVGVVRGEVTNSSAVRVKTVAQLKKLCKDNLITIVGYFKTSKNNTAFAAFKNISSIIPNEDGMVFALASKQELYDDAKLKSNNHVVLYRKTDEKDDKRYDMAGEINESSIVQFIITNRLPFVTEFNPAEEVHYNFETNLNAQLCLLTIQRFN